MYFDRQITITVGASRQAANWMSQTILVSELYDRLKSPVRSSETLADYLKLSKAERDNLKDVGGFIAGSLTGRRRLASNITGRDIISLDLDNIPAGACEDVLKRIESLGCGYCVHSTRKHSTTAPRLRVYIPTDRTMTPDEYAPVARKMCEYIGVEFADPTTFDLNRLMFWPSICKDSQYVYHTKDAPFLSVEGILQTYTDWHDTAEWPTVPGEGELQTRNAKKQGDPEQKPGIVGAFCRVYDIEAAIAAFIPDAYTETDKEGRLTYTGGSTQGGAVLYDNGKFLYSNHATDPCSGRLVNAFDLVRLHRFSELDEEAKPDTPVNRLPSYIAMTELAASDKAVATLINRERSQTALDDFADIAGEAPDDDVNWQSELQVSQKTGLPKPTIDNIWIILEHDPLLKGKFALNEFAGRGEVLGALPWDKSKKRRLWDDNDSQGLYWYLEKYYQITGKAKIDAALSLHATHHAFNDVQSYLTGLVWDGVPRLDTLIVDYLGALDTPYVRAVTRKAFTAAVARAMQPGVKFDNMLILTGDQGIGKSTLLDKMSRGWFNDSIRTFEGKEASELLQGVWIVEVAELDAFRRTDVSRIKQFLSLRTDRFRAAYGRFVKEQPRSCVFFGTCNPKEFLQDTTGNRRFWPVDTSEQENSKSVWKDLDEEIDQLWAEAVQRWRDGEELFLDKELEAIAQEKQEQHREALAREGIILDFISKQVPSDWQRWALDKRKTYWAGGCVDAAIELTDRDRICAVEIWCEAFGGAVKDMKQTDAREINAILARAEGWERTKGSVQMGSPYGKQRGYIRNS